MTTAAAAAATTATTTTTLTTVEAAPAAATNLQSGDSIYTVGHPVYWIDDSSPGIPGKVGLYPRNTRVSFRPCMSWSIIPKNKNDMSKELGWVGSRTE